MAHTLKTKGSPFDWSYLVLMFMVFLGLLIIFSVFVVGPIEYLLER